MSLDNGSILRCIFNRNCVSAFLGGTETPLQCALAEINHFLTVSSCFLWGYVKDKIYIPAMPQKLSEVYEPIWIETDSTNLPVLGVWDNLQHRWGYLRKILRSFLSINVVLSVLRLTKSVKTWDSFMNFLNTHTFSWPHMLCIFATGANAAGLAATGLYRTGSLFNCSSSTRGRKAGVCAVSKIFPKARSSADTRVKFLLTRKQTRLVFVKDEWTDCFSNPAALGDYEENSIKL